MRSRRYPGRYSSERMLKYPGLTVGADMSELVAKAAVAKDTLNAADERAEGREDKWAQQSLKRAREEAEEAFAELDRMVDSWNTSLDELKSDLDAAVAAETVRRERHRDTRAALADLPQLFIAV